MACTPSARWEDLEPQSSSVFAEEGTLAHEVSEVMLRSQLKLISPQKRTSELSRLKNNPLFSGDMLKHAENYKDYIFELIDTYSHTSVEARVDFSTYVPDGFGTCDAVVIRDGVMHVVDYKYGMGVRVTAYNNSQLQLYAVGAYLGNALLYNITEVSMHIYQPRLDHISVSGISVKDLLTWAENEVKPKALIATSGEGDPVTGDHCKFCRVKAKCPALKVLAKKDFLPQQLALATDDEILEVYGTADLLQDYLEAIKKYVQDRALEGKNWQGYKLVEGRSTRVLGPGAEKVLLDSGYEVEQTHNTKLKGLGELEKLLGKQGFEEVLGEHCTKPQGKPTLVPESDKREVWNSLAQSQKDFE
jgi:hypothetical protein